MVSGNPALHELFAAAIPTQAGVSVSPAAALRCAPVSCAVRAIAEPLATLPLITYRRGAGATKERATDHPAYRLLHEEANDWSSAYDLKLQVTLDALTHDKGGFAHVGRNAAGKPVEILRLDPAKVTVEKLDSGEPTYKLGNQVLRRSDVIHIRPFGETGPCPLTMAREAIGLAMVMEGHGARLFRNGARPSGILSVKGRLNRDQVDRMRASWQLAHGSENSGGTAIFDDSAAYTPIAFSSVDSQYVELRMYQVQEIARAFRVPPHMLYDMGRATWSNVGDMGAEFLRYTLLPWLETWQGAVARALFTPEERGEYLAEFMVDDLLRADITARAGAYSTLIAARVISPNEARAMENRAPYSGGEIFANPNVTVTTRTTGPASREED